MVLRKNKQILIISVITLLVLVFSTSVISLFIVKVKEGRENEKVRVNALAYDLRSYDDSSYDECVEFKITDEYGLTMLAKAVKDYGRNFKGKTVTLTTDLDLGGANFGVDGTFAGTFDGGGYTISNFTINECYRRYKNDVFMIHWFYEYGFFVKLTGTVKNLCLKDYMGPEKLYSFGGIDNDVDNGALHVIIGGFAGTADNGRVENCQSINFKYLGSSANTYRCNTEFYISGVVGAGNVEIINCYVEELNTLSFWDSTRGFQYDREIYVSAFTAGVNIKQDITFGENYKVTSDGFQVTDSVYNDSTPSKLTANETATSVSNCKTETNDVSGL